MEPHDPGGVSIGLFGAGLVAVYVFRSVLQLLILAALIAVGGLALGLSGAIFLGIVAALGCPSCWVTRSICTPSWS